MTVTNKAFKSELTTEKRVQLSNKIRAMYPDRLPIIVEKAPNSQVPEITKKKFLAPSDMTVAKFLIEIKKQLHPLGSYENSNLAIFMFVDKTVLPPSSHLMSQIYEKHRDADGFLYVTYSGENTFGGW